MKRYSATIFKRKDDNYTFGIGDIEDENGELCKYSEVSELLAIAKKGLFAVQSLIGESRGVDGLHKNGEVAPWDDLRSGGRYEEWLRDFDEALEQMEKT